MGLTIVRAICRAGQLSVPVISGAGELLCVPRTARPCSQEEKQLRHYNKSVDAEVASHANACASGERSPAG
jgi:hypothetical protein